MKKYTTEDNKIILNNISRFPTNITQALEKSAIELERSYEAINKYYYRKLRRTTNVISCGSKKGFSYNVKVHPRKDGKNLREEELTMSNYLPAMVYMQRLPIEEKKKIIHFLQMSIDINI